MSTQPTVLYIVRKANEATSEAMSKNGDAGVRDVLERLIASVIEDCARRCLDNSHDDGWWFADEVRKLKDMP